jgi:putative SOS response-associated peptidase YedK
VKYAIKRADGSPMGLAGLWGLWPDKKTGQQRLSFTMLTINAEGHAIFQRMHKPGEEKRMVVILDEADYDAWLNGPVEQARSYLKPYPAEKLICFPAER